MAEAAILEFPERTPAANDPCNRGSAAAAAPRELLPAFLALPVDRTRRHGPRQVVLQPAVHAEAEPDVVIP